MIKKNVLIRGKLPGPKAKKIIARDHRILSPSFTRPYPFVVETAKGAWMKDPDGNVFLDFTAGIAVTQTGHCHPAVVKAIKKQADRYLHMSGTDFYYEPQIALAEKLAAHAPGSKPKRVFFTNSGAEAVEAAFKLARYKTGRERMIAFFGAFHGRTMGALSLTGSKVKQKAHFGQLVPGVTHVDYPNPFRDALTQSEAGGDAVDYIEKVLFKKNVPPEEVAAVIIEPIQGEGGYIVPPENFHRRLRELTRKFGILLIADEVQSGMGRTGKMFAMEHWGVEPDIITAAKGIASGLPLGAVIARADLMEWEPGSHGTTFGGNPVACAAALATVKLLESGLIQNAENTGGYLQLKLRELYKRYPIIGDVRGIGLMVGMEIVKDREKFEPAAGLRDAIIEGAFQRGLLLLGCGESTIRFSPPLVVGRREVKIAVDIIEKTIKSLE
jgi:4-aminobutyrate aminotransferase